MSSVDPTILGSAPVLRESAAKPDPLAQFRLWFEQAQAAGVGIFPRRDPQHRLEAPLQVEWTLAKSLAEAIQRHGLVYMLLDVATDRLHSVGLRIAACGLWLTAQTSAVASLLRLLGVEEEGDVLPPWAARRTGRPAIHSGRRDGEDERTVVRGISPDDCVPAQAVFIGCLDASLPCLLWLRDWHFARSLNCEYGIGSHSKESLWRCWETDYPNLAGKVILMA